MKYLSAKAQMTLGLVCLQVSVLCGAMLFGLVPDRRSAVTNGRADLCEAVAIVSSQLIGRNQSDELSIMLTEMVDRNDHLLSAAIRSSGNELLTEIGDHLTSWDSSRTRSTADEVLVPIFSQNGRWGSVEMRFQPLAVASIPSLIQHPWVLMTLAISLASGVLYNFYLRKMLKHLDLQKRSQSVFERLWILWRKACWFWIASSALCLPIRHSRNGPAYRQTN